MPAKIKKPWYRRAFRVLRDILRSPHLLARYIWRWTQRGKTHVVSLSIWENVAKYPPKPWYRRLYRRLRNRMNASYRVKIGVLIQYPPRGWPRVEFPEKQPGIVLPSLAIVTPSFGQADFIERSIRSVVEQGYPSLEYIVQDGGSTDGTVEILKEWEGRLGAWRSARDRGQSQAINLGFAGTSGEIMAWLNSDDVFVPGALNFIGAFFAANPDIDVIYGDRIIIDEEDRCIGHWVLPDHDDDALSYADFTPQETLFWRRSLWDRVGGVDETFRFAMDWDLIVRFRDAGAKFAHVPYFLGAFRIHMKQKTSAEISEIGMVEMDRIRERLLKYAPTKQELRDALEGYFQAHIAAERRHMRIHGVDW